MRVPETWLGSKSVSLLAALIVQRRREKEAWEKPAVLSLLIRNILKETVKRWIINNFLFHLLPLFIYGVAVLVIA